MNPSKCETITFSTKHLKPTHPNLSLDNQPLREVTSHTHLGLTLIPNLSWSQHIFGMHKKASKKLNVLKSMKYRLDRSTLISLYKSLIRPVMEYADVIWDGCSEYESNILEGIQYEAARVVTGAIKGTSKGRLLNELCWEDLKTRRYLHKMFFLHKIINLLTPSYLRDFLPLQVSERSEYSL